MLVERIEKAQSDDEELLEDAIVENKQAIEMANVYSSILDVTMEAYSSVISNNLNTVMKVLTSLTIILTIPTMIFSFFGMNVQFGWIGTSCWSWVLALLLMVISTSVVFWIFKSRKMF